MEISAAVNSTGNIGTIEDDTAMGEAISFSAQPINRKRIEAWEVQR